MTIGVTGATGHLGLLTIEALKRRVGAAEIVALARTPDKLADTAVTVRAFDYDDASTLAPSLAGIGTLAFISSSEIGKRLTQHHHVIAAAKAAGVRHIIYTSVLHADASPLSVAQEHLPTEAELKVSGIPFTILRNGWYTENYMGGVSAALQHGAFIGSSGAGKISSATRADYAEALAVVATTGGHDGKTYELAGDAGWTRTDLAREVSRQSGRELPYNEIPEADYAAAMVGAGLPQGFAQMLARWEIDTTQGALFDDGRQLSTLIARPTTTLTATVAETLQQA